jgi:hypothetical protein
MEVSGERPGKLGEIMTKLTALFAGAVLSLAASGAYAGTNLVTNGSFESGTFVPTDGNYSDILNPGSTAMTGWTVVDTANAQVAWDGPTNPYGLTASNGSYFLDLTSDRDAPPYGGVTQTISTVAGGNYVLTFDLGSSLQYGVPDGLTAYAGATSELFSSTSSGYNVWTTETLDFTATSSSTVLSFIGAFGGEYIGLDNVDVQLVPEPAALGLLLVGMTAVGVASRRRRG